MTLPANDVLGDLTKLSTSEVIERVMKLSLDQIVGGSKKLPFGITQSYLKKLQKRLRAQGFPEPSPKYFVFVYIAGPITGTKQCPNMQVNRQRIHKAALSLFLLGYLPYCPSVPWFDDPSTYNLWYFLILAMDAIIIRHLGIKDHPKAFYACAHSRASTGVNFEEPIAAETKQSIFFERQADKKHFERLSKKKRPKSELRVVS